MKLSFMEQLPVINEAIGLSGIYDELGIPMTIVLQLDSTARDRDDSEDVERDEHVTWTSVICSCKSGLRDGTIGAIEKIDTSVNLADVGTKHFTASRLEELKRFAWYGWTW